MKEYHVLKINSIHNLPRAPPKVVLYGSFISEYKYKITGGIYNVNNRKNNKRA